MGNRSNEFRSRGMVSVLMIGLGVLAFGWTSTAQAATSGNLTTVTVANVGPVTASAGARKVALLSFTLRATAADTFKNIVVHYSGTSVADISTVYLYKESGAVPGVFDSATDTLLTSAAASTDTTLNPTDFAVGATSNVQFYVAVDVASGAVDGHLVDFEIQANQISFSSGTWPSTAEANAGTWNPSGSTALSTPSLSITSTSVTEGDSGTVPAIFTVT